MTAPLGTHHPIVAAPHANRVETLAVNWLCMMHVCEAKEIISSTFFKYTEYSRSITAVHLNATHRKLELSLALSCLMSCKTVSEVTNGVGLINQGL